MGMNKQQKQAAERAKKSAAPEVKLAEPPKPEATAAAPSVPANKQTATFDKLKEAWTAKGVDLSKMTATPDGKYLDVVVAEGWPLIMIGASGGITLPEIRSYPRAFEAAIDGLALYQKQQARDAKKSQGQPAAPTPAVAAPVTLRAAKETPTAKKGKAHEQIEQQLQSASA